MATTLRNAGRTQARLSSLDFVKGVLVVLMILYHWLNYFVYAPTVFKYLRFLTPSFIFITGFLITHVYLSRYSVDDSRLPRRLMTRGAKILAVFVVLNVGRSLLIGNFDVLVSGDSLISTYVTGGLVVQSNVKAAAFQILVPISYLLFISAALLVLSRRYRYSVPLACVLLLGLNLGLAANGVSVGYLELLSIGLVGLLLGYLPAESITALTRYRFVIVAGYVAYLTAITLWGEIFVLQVIGVCLTLGLIYVLYGREGPQRRTTDVVVLLGQYSLIGYIGQIAILQMLRRAVRIMDVGDAGIILTLAVAVVLTIVLVWILDRARSRAPLVNRCYALVFS